MTPAPPFNCAECRRRIGKTPHILLGYPDVSADRIICARCAGKGAHWHLHSRFYPDCTEQWHDLYDHGTCSATRAGAARLLGLWP